MRRTRTWYAFDALFHSDPKVAELGDTFGPGGPFAVVVLLGLAKLEGEDRGDGRRIRTRWGMLARYAFLRNAAQGKEIVARCGELGLLDDIQTNEQGFAATFPHWTRWQATDRTATDRKQAERGRDEDGASQATKEEREAIERLFALWLKAMDKPVNTKLSSKRVNLARKLLRTRDGQGEAITEERLARAILGCAGSDFHMGRPPEGKPGKVFNDLILIFRSVEDFERFEAMPAADPDAAERRREEEDDDLRDAYGGDDPA